ncbi:DUF2156 domain-containing protein [Marinobacter sp. S6332]|uniref:DUF2156 domain-containing protein n=1 Tax=Marinobacter sp. S6332 TaxID=2926403 RepID=UPI001FF349FE|nr:DUF2156 domain-containing protein [Marinobacter sp. S6332]MCK0164406.1 DUF2156 domain-containing protein [Marinobacter sp. S6332]
MAHAPSPDAGIRYREHLAQGSSQELMKRYGRQSSAYFTLQSGAERFGIEGVGFVAYAPVRTLLGRVNVVFANPVCADQSRRGLLREFLNNVPGRALFVGIDGGAAEDLRALGHTINEMGTEFSFRIPSFSVAGKNKKQLRHAANLGKRQNLTVIEQTEDEADLTSALRISEAWRRNKVVKQRELRLLTRPPEFGDEWGVRKFYCYQEGRLLGYVFFDPFFQDGKVIGYTANVLRQDTGNSPSGLLDYIILEAMKVFETEGVEQISLGISPVYNVQPCPGDSKLVRSVCRLLYEKGNRFYAFKALSYHKSRYRANETKWFMAYKDTPVLTMLWTVLRGTGILGRPPLITGGTERHPNVPVSVTL